MTVAALALVIEPVAVIVGGVIPQVTVLAAGATAAVTEMPSAVWEHSSL